MIGLTSGLMVCLSDQLISQSEQLTFTPRVITKITIHDFSVDDFSQVKETSNTAISDIGLCLAMKLCGKQMRRSTIMNLICEKADDLVVLSAHDNELVVFFRSIRKATLNMIKDSDKDDNLEVSLDVVATHQLGVFGDGVQAWDTPNENLQRQSLPSLLARNLTTSAIKNNLSKSPLECTTTKRKRFKHMHDYLVHCFFMMSCCAPSECLQ